MRDIRVNLGDRSYSILIKKGLLEYTANYIKEVFTGGKVAIISDENVFSCHGLKVRESLKACGYSTREIVLKPGESNKLIDNLPALYGKLLELNITRSDLIIALGGGVIGDLAGFIASTYLRGIAFIQIPTSLLAQVDSSVGGKVAVDLIQGKNLVGSFYQPRLVLIDPVVLDTLSEHFFRDGMAEVIKYGCILDKRLFSMLSKLNDRSQVMENIEEIIYTCCNLKRIVVEEDERDMGPRMKLNFGHTIGHAIESYTHYQGYSHGQAVAIGMAAITRISEAKGLTKEGTAKRVITLLRQHSLPTELEVDISTLKPYVVNDKKNVDENLKLILLREIGESFLYENGLDFLDGNIYLE